MRPDQKVFVVTGASSGIGRAIADHLVAKGHFVFTSVRKQVDADALNAAYGANGEAVLFDVVDSAAIEAAAADIGKKLAGRRLSGLVNNAGIALPGPALIQPMAEIEQVMDINFMGVVRATRAFAPLLGADPALSGTKGRIVNITSVSGKFGYPFTAAYAASKHAVEGFSESIRRELLLLGIDVIVVGPGAVKTPIWDKGAATGAGKYDETIWGGALKRLTKSLEAMDKSGLEPEVVAACVEHALTSPNPKTRYAPVPNKLANWWIPRLLPTRMVDQAIGKSLGLLPK